VEVIAFVEWRKVSAVLTTSGRIATPLRVNAAGPWAGVVGQMAGVDIPIVPSRRQMLTTTPCQNSHPTFHSLSTLPNPYISTAKAKVY
jgi:glycine/D-amino acid oxidase-like deaminating enzyme